MSDKSREIFGNQLSDRAYRKACRGKERHVRRFGDDSQVPCHLDARPAPAVGEALGVRWLVPAQEGGAAFDLAADAATCGCGKPVVVGNIRMGFGHYRIAMAMASAAHAMGFTPYWLDLCGFPATTCTKIIANQNKLYSMGSRISQRSRLFNRFVWDPLNSEGFRKLSYNASDQKAAELMTAPYRDLPRDVPFVGTHAWTAQAALHAGLTHVVNAIPDNWPMALHLAEGAVHTVQTPSSFLGYKMLRGMDGRRVLRPMPASSLVCTGHYVDHEIVANIEDDCARRRARIEAGAPIRYLITVGGAGAQRELIAKTINHLAPCIEAGSAALLVNVGDHRDVWRKLVADCPVLRGAVCHFDDFEDVVAFADAALDGEVSGAHAFYDGDIFGAVYSTNLLMRACDVLVTKPSELAYYPVPKLMIKHVGGHEVWGAIRAAELGDGTYEMENAAEVCAMVDAIQAEPELIGMMCLNIVAANTRGVYDGAYQAVRLAVEG